MKSLVIANKNGIGQFVSETFHLFAVSSLIRSQKKIILKFLKNFFVFIYLFIFVFIYLLLFFFFFFFAKVTWKFQQ